MPVEFRKNEFSQHEPKFRWPDSSEHLRCANAMARAGELLVREIARVGWDLADIDVEIDTVGAGAQAVRLVRKVSGRTDDGPFELEFCGLQGRLQHATVPPGVEIVFYDERSGPTAYLYTGRRWARDGSRFMGITKTNAKLNGAERLYLKYSGRGGERILPHDGDFGREYAPKGREPVEVDSRAIEQDVVRFVESLRASLAALPTAPGAEDVTEHGDAVLRGLARPEKIPVPDGFPPLFVWVERNDAYRLKFDDPDEPDRLEGLNPSGARLVYLGMGSPGLHERATESFTYATAHSSERVGHVVHSPRDDSLPAVVRLSCLNDVFVVDNAVYDRIRKAMWYKVKAEDRKEFNGDEIARGLRAVGLTMVPATEYSGGYQEPVYLIGRRLEKDEIRMASGTVVMSVDEDARTTKVVVRDDETGHEFGLFEREMIGDRTSAAARRAAEEAVRFVAARRVRDLLPPPKEPEGQDIAARLGL